MAGGLDGNTRIFLSVFAGILSVFMFFLQSLSHTIVLIRPRNRQLSPASVWLCLIPFAGVFVAIWMVRAISISLRLQFEELREDDPSGKHAVAAGLRWTFSIAALLMIWIAGLVFYPLGFSALIATLVLLFLSFASWIDYWEWNTRYQSRLKKLVPAQYSADELDYADDIQDPRQ